MDVLISWAGKQSQGVGSQLFDWLNETIPGVSPWISSESIAPGSNWVQTLMEKLETTRFCLICLTPENVRSPWLYFEAGAIAGRRGDAKVCGYLAGVDSSQLQGGPLSLFQWVEASKEGTWKLVREINRGLERPNDEKLLEAGFDRRWPALKLRLEKTLIETAATGADRETEALKPVYRLSAEADTLLREAAADPHGQVMMARTRSGLFVQTNKRQFTEQMSARSEATWQGAVRELLQKGLLENAGSKGEVFRVTTEGYRAADDLKSGRSSAATEG
ncbi:MAG: toll/interleukin-1 receptor domain-containing protein [Acidimicrobiales bacterium]